ncbi:cysteine synthase K/M:Cysteine synthase B [Nannizzia gypsea CBS 118893]|uniref:Cysteine synthase K/M:Cysteine synthase B n=1 Tax=Arthroderma gypseum (strain ATCC MYA-4604 / CBS 118893) TaxID=535722 RepID=E4UXH3_ARTGP|nr:cysteine synthase K/M:Cysteine synthase B [Nannizzia gypsea CBS 118893]EFR01921.1 cysteine synthase K/M:Cysteine synthase B [Nannizzia gypsea CBS 118893]
MANINPLNVYTGQDSMKKYLNPDCQPSLPLVEIPQSLNPFYDDGVRVYAKMMTMHPTNNVKAIPAFNLLETDVVPGKTKTVIEYSSGSTIMSMAVIANAVYGISDVRAYFSNKSSDAKIHLLQFFGINVTLFGGPTQPDPLDHRGGIFTAQKSALDSEEVINPNQYENDGNWQGHVKYTGPQIFKQLPEINVICCGIGTSGTMTGLGQYFQKAKPSVLRVGVFTAPGDLVPGPRTHALMTPVEFPWKSSMDALEEVKSPEAFLLSLKLSRQGLVCGPSSGLNLQGLYQQLQKRKDAGTLSSLAGPDGKIHCVFLCCDLPYQYIDTYFDKVNQEEFPPVTNNNLRKVDLYRYDDLWETEPAKILSEFYKTSPSTGLLFGVGNAGSFDSFQLKEDHPRCIIDIRKPADFEQWHLPQAINVPLNTLEKDTTSPFSDSAVLEAQWLEIEGWFNQSGEKSALLTELKAKKTRVLLACYSGNTSRVATSVLRAKGIEAWCIRGGHKALGGPDVAPVGLHNVQASTPNGFHPSLKPIRIN